MINTKKNIQSENNIIDNQFIPTEPEKPIHTFAICAYKESPYLEACIRSLMGQTERTQVICCTSTPNRYIERLTEKYGIPLYVREGESGIREDWLFAYDKADGGLVTIAHQDDCYGRNYAKAVLDCARRYPDMTVFCSDYVTLMQEEGVSRPKAERFNKVWLVKKLLRLPLRARRLANRKLFKRAALIFGNSICCPSCTYNKERISGGMFCSEYEFALDWDNLYELAGKEGRFVCVEKPLIAYRVHALATTKACIEDHRRTRDEVAMFAKMWPGPVVKILMYFYKKAYSAYEIPKSTDTGKDR